VIDLSHIGREALDTMLVIRKWEQAGVQVWSAHGQRISALGMRR
jgi:hypothetical protein